jgi:Ca2+-binding RTX toxin-like protein
VESGDGTRDVFATIFDPRDDLIRGTDSADVITSRVDGATIKAKKGKDVLLGLDANDELFGNRGNDWLVGGDGNDSHRGGRGKDRFLFDVDPDKTTNVDHVRDFKHAKDKMVLLDDVFDAVGKKLGRGEFEVGRNADDGNHYVIFKETGKKKNKLFYDADGNGDGEKVLFATVKQDADLTFRDFKVVEDFLL